MLRVDFDVDRGVFASRFPRSFRIPVFPAFDLRVKWPIDPFTACRLAAAAPCFAFKEA